MGRKRLTKDELEEVSSAKKPTLSSDSRPPVTTKADFPVSPAGIRLCEGYVWGHFPATWTSFSSHSFRVSVAHSSSVSSCAIHYLIQLSLQVLGF